MLEVKSAMKKRFSVEQIVTVLKQAELSMPVADLSRRGGIPEWICQRLRQCAIWQRLGGRDRVLSSG